MKKRIGILKDVTDKQITDAIKTGSTFNDMAALFKCGYHNIYDRVKSMGITDKVAKADQSEAAKKRAKSLKRVGTKNDVIAIKIPVRPDNKRRYNIRIPKSTLRELLVTKGMSGEEAADVLGVSTTTVSRRAREFGISNRSRRRGKQRSRSSAPSPVEDSRVMNISDAEHLDSLMTGNCAIKGFIPMDGYIQVVIANGLGFKFRGDFQLTSKDDVAAVKEYITKRRAEVMRLSKLLDV